MAFWKAEHKQETIRYLRRLRLLSLIDYFHYLFDLIKNRSPNREFIRQYPGVLLPPPFLAYDAFGHTNWQSYWVVGKQHGQYISELIEQHGGDKVTRICEWGCGPARILRHMADINSGRPLELYGFDYNEHSIRWCQESFRQITFKVNNLAPPLPQDANWFDCLYCISVFTHLSEEMHFQWINELIRVVKPGGLIILTTHGDACRNHLLQQESHLYSQGELVVRGNVKEGKRTFVAYHPPSFVRDKLLNGLEVIDHKPTPADLNLGQDIWIVRNTKL